MLKDIASMSEIDESLESELPYVSGDLRGVGGVLRAKPEHFLVEEIPLYEPTGRGQHLYVNLTKMNMTTREVQKTLASAFELHHSKIGFAGLKDKHAMAIQTFSVPVEDKAQSSIEKSMRLLLADSNLKINWTRLHTNKMRSGHLLGNRFAIIITDLEVPPDEALHRSNIITARLMDQGIPNYYGPQRLSGGNVEKGLEIIKGRTIGDRWLQRLLVSSFQSELCNRYLAKRMEIGLFDRIIRGDIAKKYSTGGMFEVEDERAEQQRYRAHEISFTAPIYGSKMWVAKGLVGELEDRILAESGVTIEQLGRMGLKGTRRLGRLLIGDLQIDVVDKGLRLSFSLPKGAFATTVLREFMKV